eukprot:TRINITY_DN168_c0_g1_i3.p1 TRINITY_DN168_c0_g1~~TRINITY_DN168_c0_g1_i3.p1  ORF type:complete len:487 (+),score=98.39 TRINITY_DN168_c0_g1_i3:54-1514(+)
MSHHPEVPEIRSFVELFSQAAKDRNHQKLKTVYDNWSKVTEKYFKQSEWPTAKAMSSLADDPVFVMLYKEFYFRHLFSKLYSFVTLEQRFESWENYSNIFKHFLESPSPLPLPNVWIWDMIDEFIYQFQDYCHYRYIAKIKSKSEEEIDQIKEHTNVWKLETVLIYLNSLVKNGSKDGAHDVLKMLGYFSTVGLLRIHCLLGDYHLALDSIKSIDLHKKGPFTQVTACHITLYYYLGFAYMMMRRFVDASKTFANVLLYISRISNKQYTSNPRNSQQDQKREGQMYALLAIVMSFCPMQRIDEHVKNVLKDKYGEKMIRMQRGELIVLEELFSYACPKFVNPAIPNYDDEVSFNQQQAALRLQLKVFSNEVQQLVLLPTIRSYLKLYTSIGLDKLAKFLEMDKEALRNHLLCYTHKNRTKIWRGGPPLDGQWGSSSDTEFYIDGDMIHVVDTKVERRFGEFFIRHINKFDEIIGDVLDEETVSKST